MSVTENTAKNMKRYRKDRGLTQKELAEKMDFAETTIQKWESGKNCLSVQNLVDLCEIFEISLEDMLMGETLNNNVRFDYNGSADGDEIIIEPVATYFNEEENIRIIINFFTYGLSPFDEKEMGFTVNKYKKIIENTRREIDTVIEKIKQNSLTYEEMYDYQIESYYAFNLPFNNDIHFICKQVIDENISLPKGYIDYSIKGGLKYQTELQNFDDMLGCAPIFLSKVLDYYGMQYDIIEDIYGKNLENMMKISQTIYESEWHHSSDLFDNMLVRHLIENSVYRNRELDIQKNLQDYSDKKRNKIIWSKSYETYKYKMKKLLNKLVLLAIQYIKADEYYDMCFIRRCMESFQLEGDCIETFYTELYKSDKYYNNFHGTNLDKACLISISGNWNTPDSVLEDIFNRLPKIEDMTDITQVEVLVNILHNVRENRTLINKICDILKPHIEHDDFETKFKDSFSSKFLKRIWTGTNTRGNDMIIDGINRLYKINETLSDWFYDYREELFNNYE